VIQSEFPSNFGVEIYPNAGVVAQTKPMGILASLTSEPITTGILEISGG
jgi:hypothetical protein